MSKSRFTNATSGGTRLINITLGRAIELPEMTILGAKVSGLSTTHEKMKG